MKGRSGEYRGDTCLCRGPSRSLHTYRVGETPETPCIHVELGSHTNRVRNGLEFDHLGNLKGRLDGGSNK